MMESVKNYYKRLGISETASEEEIRKAFHLAARKIHPDVNVEPGATELFLEIKEAYETLIDPIKRAEYDGGLSSSREITPIKASIHYSQAELPRVKEKQLLYVLIELKLEQEIIEKYNKRTPLNIALVLDTSTSMQGSRLDGVKSTALEIVEKLSDEDILSIVSFADRGKVVIPAEQQRDRHRIESEILRLQTGGGTEIYQGLLDAFVEIRRNLSARYNNHIILLTDGHTYGDEYACYNLADQCASLGIGISCLGIGHEWNDEFLENLSKRTGGSCVYIARSKDIRKFLTEKFEGLSQTIATQVSFDFMTGSGVQLSYAFRLLPEPGKLPLDSPMLLGSVQEHYGQKILLELEITPLNPTINQLVLLTGDITYHVPKVSEEPYRLPITLMRKITDKPPKHEPRADLVEAMSKLTLYRMQEKAQKHIEEGDINKAREQLEFIATHLFSKGNTRLAKTVIMEANNLEKHNALSDKGSKTIKYGTRALLLPSGLEREEHND